MPARPHLDPAGVSEALIETALGEEPDPAARRDRFLRAVARPPEETGPPGDAPILGQLARADIVGMGRIPYASNAVFLLELAAADPHRREEPMRAVYKPARGERPLWDFPRHTLHLREVAAYQVSAALEMPLVPPTVLREGPLGPGSCQLFIHQLRGRPPEHAAAAVDAQLHQLAALDVVINNADRKRAHLLIAPPHRVYGIDNALTFLPYPRQRTVLLELGGSRLPRSAVRRVARLAADTARRLALRDRLSLLLGPAEVAAADARLDELASDPVYPVLDPWEGRPFEWW